MKLKNANNVEKTKTLIVVWGFVIVNVVDGPLSLSLSVLKHSNVTERDFFFWSKVEQEIAIVVYL